MRGIPEIVDNDWVLPTQGITVLTGRNNVGKTRLLQAIAALGPDAPWPDPLPHARIEVGDTVIELEAVPQAAPDGDEGTGAGGSNTTTGAPDPPKPAWEPHDL